MRHLDRLESLDLIRPRRLDRDQTHLQGLAALSQFHLKHANQALEEQVNAGRDQTYLQGLAALSQFHQNRAEMLERKGDSNGSEREWEEAMRHKQLLADKVEKLSMKHRL